MAIEDAGGEVVGPVSSVTEAFALLDARSVDAAILDVNLADRDASPLVEHFLGQGVPFVLQTGVGLPAALEARFPALVVQTKPCVAAELVAQLIALMSERSASARLRSPSPAS